MIYAFALRYAPSLIWWSAPLTAGYVLAIPYAMATASVDFGRKLTDARLCALPEEFERTPILDALNEALAENAKISAQPAQAHA